MPTTTGSSAAAFHARFADDAATATHKRARPAVDRGDIALITSSFSLSPQAALAKYMTQSGLHETPVDMRSFSDLFPSQPSAPSNDIDVAPPHEEDDEDATPHDDHDEDATPHETPRARERA